MISQKNHFIHYCSQGNNEQLWFDVFFCNLLGTLGKMSFHSTVALVKIEINMLVMMSFGILLQLI